MPSPIPITRLLPKDFGLEFGACSSPISKTASGYTLRVPTNAFHGKIAHRLWSSVIHWRELQALEPIGSGGFGTVFKGTYFDQTAVVKKVICVKNKLASRQSFWAELTAAHLHHQNILRVTEVTTCTPTHLSTKDNIGTIVMEFAGVLNLQQVIYGLVACGQVREIFSGHRARALQHLHVHGIAHLDLKPANVLVSEQGVCTLSWGIIYALPSLGMFLFSLVLGRRPPASDPPQISLAMNFQFYCVFAYPYGPSRLTKCLNFKCFFFF